MALKISCSSVTLDAFVDCLVNGNLRRLSDTATEQELHEAWGALCAEYGRLSGGQQNGYAFSLRRRVAALGAKLSLAGVALCCAGEARRTWLKKAGYAGSDAERRMALDTVLYEDARRELEAVEKESGGGGESMTSERFTRWIVSVSKFMGFSIDRRTVTVLEFLQMSTLLEESVKIGTK
jgi:hypothetical protein